jgi:hypothetical protein
LEAGTAFRGLSKTSHIETFFLAETKAGTGTQGTETEAGAAETFGTIGVVRTAGTEAKVILAIRIVEIAGIAEIGAGTGTGVALGMEAFCARLNKNSR